MEAEGVTGQECLAWIGVQVFAALCQLTGGLQGLEMEFK